MSESRSANSEWVLLRDMQVDASDVTRAQYSYVAYQRRLRDVLVWYYDVFGSQAVWQSQRGL